jgi:CheY-like chemotaxis protein
MVRSLHTLFPAHLFTFCLAIRRRPVVTPDREVAMFASKVPQTRSSRVKVLIIEDHRDAAESMRMLLELTGYEARVAYTGCDGVDVARTWGPDIVLSDLGLPGLDGFAVAETLRHTPTTASCRIIAISGYGGDDIKERCRHSGFDQHLTKPVDIAALQPMLAVPSIAPTPVNRGEFQP